MTDKVQKIREKVERLKSQLLRGACSSQVAMETRCKEEAYNDVLGIFDSMQEEPKSKFEQSIQEGDNIVYNEDLDCRVNLSQLDRVAKKEEPVSEDLEKAAKRYATEGDEISGLYIIEPEADAFKAGAQWQKENLWKPADGDDLPEYDREVIAILNYDFGHYKVVYAHRPNPDGWNGTNIDTEEKEHFEPVIYDKGGWNQPHVLYWLDAKLPYEENKITK